MTRTKLPSINTVSEWLASTLEITNTDSLGLTQQGKAAWKLWDQFQLVSATQINRETEKAICVRGTRWNQYAKPVSSTAWFPKSQIRELTNDYWINGAARMFLIPVWLINAKKADGFSID